MNICRYIYFPYITFNMSEAYPDDCEYFWSFCVIHTRHYEMSSKHLLKKTTLWANHKGRHELYSFEEIFLARILQDMVIIF